MVEKMKLVRVQGTMPQLNEFIGSCCMDGRFDLEPATRYMSESLGYGALNEENPHTAIRDQIETMAKEANMELHEGQQHSDPVDAEGRSYLSDLLEKIDDLCAERKVLLDQKKLCEDGIEQYSHFTGLKVNVDDILDCAHVKIRFGFLPTEGYNKLMNNYGDDPYILFTPCNQTKAGYWGVYMTPREHALETDGIFSMLYFEPVHVPGAAGSPAEIIEHFKENLDVVNKSVEDVNARIAALWQQNADKVQLLYNTACYYAAVYDLRRMAAVKGEHFFCVGWVPASEVDEVAGKARGIHGLRVTVDGPESAGKMTPPTKLKNSFLGRVFQPFLEMYGLPAYNEKDPSLFMALTYCLFFGIMFGDLGQGLCLALIGLVLARWKGMWLGGIITCCGLSGALFGCVYGSVFGFEDILPGFKIMEETTFAGLGVVSNVLLLLVLSICLGVFMLLLVMVINILNGIRQKNYEKILFGPNGAAGIVFYAGLLTAAVSTLAFGVNLFTPAYVLPVLILPLVLMLLREPLSHLLAKNPHWREFSVGEVLGTGFFELFETLLSYLTNTLSFMRVGAYAITHVGLMLVVHMLAGLAGGVGGPAGILILVLGNAFVMGFEGLLVGIQVLRLEFYELFGRFYDDGGIPFVPKKIDYAARTNG